MGGRRRSSTSATARRRSRPTSSCCGARLALAVGDAERGAAELAEIVAWRRANQPGGPNAGSVFTNPPGDSAGRLIDAAGGKGLRRGTAAVSTKHANFIQADEGGRADDVHALMGEVQALVRATAGVELRPETRLVGFAAEPSTRDRGLTWPRPRRRSSRPTPIDPRIQARRIEVQRGVGRRRLQRLVDVGLVLAVAAGFALALRSPLLDVDAVRVAGAERTARRGGARAGGHRRGGSS